MKWQILKNENRYCRLSIEADWSGIAADYQDNECDPGNAVWTAASDRIRLLIILKTIAHQEGINVDETDVNNRIAVKAKGFGTTTKTLQTELAEGGGIGQLRDMLLAESTLDYLLEISQQEQIVVEVNGNTRRQA